MEGDWQSIFLPYWASMEPYELKVAPGAYRRNGFQHVYRDPNTDINYAPWIDDNFTCISGETTEVTLYLEVWR